MTALLSEQFMITNTGGRDVVINKITVRGQECTALYVDAVQLIPGTDLRIHMLHQQSRRYDD